MIKTQTELKPAAVNEDMKAHCRCEGAVIVTPTVRENGLQFCVRQDALNPANDAYFLILYGECFYIVSTDKEYYHVVAERESSKEDIANLVKIGTTHFRMHLENPQPEINIARVLLIDKALEQYVAELE